jgi:hypothetical protein
LTATHNGGKARKETGTSEDTRSSVMIDSDKTAMPNKAMGAQCRPDSRRAPDRNADRAAGSCEDALEDRSASAKGTPATAPPELAVSSTLVANIHPHTAPTRTHTRTQMHTTHDTHVNIHMHTIHRHLLQKRLLRELVQGLKSGDLQVLALSANDDLLRVSGYSLFVGEREVCCSTLTVTVSSGFSRK